MVSLYVEVPETSGFLWWKETYPRGKRFNLQDEKTFTQEFEGFLKRLNGQEAKLMIERTGKKPLPDFVAKSLVTLLKQNAGLEKKEIPENPNRFLAFFGRVFKRMKSWVTHHTIVTNIECSPGLFDANQISEIHRVLQKNNHDIVNWSRKSNWFMETVLGTIVLRFIPLALFALIAEFGGLIALGVAFAGGYARQKYLDYAARFYDSKDKIDNIKDEGEKKAFQLGCDAHTWKGYAWSFTQYRAWRNPVIFVGAMQLAMEKNPEVTSEDRKSFKIKINP